MCMACLYFHAYLLFYIILPCEDARPGCLFHTCPYAYMVALRSKGGLDP